MESDRNTAWKFLECLPLQGLVPHPVVLHCCGTLKLGFRLQTWMQGSVQGKHHKLKGSAGLVFQNQLLVSAHLQRYCTVAVCLVR